MMIVVGIPVRIPDPFNNIKSILSVHSYQILAIYMQIYVILFSKGNIRCPWPNLRSEGFAVAWLLETSDLECLLPG